MPWGNLERPHLGALQKFPRWTLVGVRLEESHYRNSISSSSAARLAPSSNSAIAVSQVGRGPGYRERLPLHPLPAAEKVADFHDFDTLMPADTQEVPVTTDNGTRSGRERAFQNAVVSRIVFHHV